MVYIILPVFNRIKHTIKFIDDLLNHTYQDFHLILVDDGSTDGSAEYVISRLGKKVTILQGKGNWWWAGSLHQAYLFLTKKAVEATDYVLIMNNDTNFESDFIQSGIEVIKNDPRTLLTANAYSLETKELADAGVTIDWDIFDFKPSDTPEQINCLSTRGLIMHFSAFKELGGFHPFLLPHYLSDYEYTHRAFKKGFKLISDRSFKLITDESATGIELFGNDSAPAFSDLFSKRCKSNPIYRINFIIISHPNLYKKIRLVAREMYYLGRTILIILRAKVRQKIK